MNQCLLQSFRFAAGTLHSTILNREHEEKHKPIAPAGRELSPQVTEGAGGR